MNSNKVLNFWSFLNEQKGQKTKVIVLTGNTQGSKTSKSFEDECKKRGAECYTVDVNKAVLEKVYNGHLIKTGEEGILIEPNSTVIVPRRGVISNSYTKQILTELENARYFTINSLESIEICENKYTTSQYLEEAGLPVPRYALVPNEDSLDQALEKIGGEFPVVMKLLSGTQGIGVSLVDSYASLKSVYQTIRKLNTESEILIQEKIDSNFDLRIQVIVKKFDPINPSPDNCIILGSMKREAVEKDFRTNYSLGGSVSSYDISEELIDIACKAANAVGCHWCGVDIMIDSKTEKPYILEVNSSPGTEGISKAIGKPIVSDVLDYILDKENWSYSNLEIGYLEMIGIPGFGTMIAKFDTGNGSKSCSIHADTVEEKGGKLIWSIGNKKFANEIIGYSDAEVGRDTDTRPIVEIDMVFNDITIPKVKVSPVTRTEKSTPFLANRKFMKRLGLIVNPNKAFVVSQSPDDKYSPMKAKGDPEAGIYPEK
jgi:ribosomal protein S6--L-glutamate ligase